MFRFKIYMTGTFYEFFGNFRNLLFPICPYSCKIEVRRIRALPKFKTAAGSICPLFTDFSEKIRQKGSLKDKERRRKRYEYRNICTAWHTWFDLISSADRSCDRGSRCSQRFCCYCRRRERQGIEEVSRYGISKRLYVGSGFGCVSNRRGL